MGSHNITCHPTQINAPRLNASRRGWYSIYVNTAEGWKAELTLLRLVVAQQSEPQSDPLTLFFDLLLHEVEAHGKQRKAERQPERTKNQLLAGRPLVHVRAGHYVTEADCRQRDEAEVRPGQVVPILPEREQHSPGENIPGDDNQADGDWNSHFAAVTIPGVVIIKRVVDVAKRTSHADVVEAQWLVVVREGGSKV